MTKRYPRTLALNEISFKIGNGEIFGFVGPNGAGKTTTLKILATLLKPTSGEAFVDGVDVVADPYSARGRIGYMPDFFGVYDRLTASEYLAFYAGCYEIPRPRIGRIVVDLLQLIGLESKAQEPVDSLSRGMKQRLCLARALVHDPSVLLLDEPASGLDPVARVEMRELLKELRAMDKTIIISSHILSELTELCTSYGIISNGRMLGSGPLDSLKQAGGAARFRMQVGGHMETALEKALSVPDVSEASPEGETIVLSYTGMEPEGLLKTLIAAGVDVRSFNRIEEDLEQTFLRLVEAQEPA